MYVFMYVHIQVHTYFVGIWALLFRRKMLVFYIANKKTLVEQPSWYEKVSSGGMVVLVLTSYHSMMILKLNLGQKYIKRIYLSTHKHNRGKG